MDTYGWPSILPPILAIGLAIKTKQVFLSLALFVYLGWTIMSGWDPMTGLIASVDAYVAAITSADSTMKRATTTAAMRSSSMPIAWPMRATTTAPVVRVSMREW